MKLGLTTIREFEYDQKSLINELSEEEFKKQVGVCLIHPETYNKIVSKSGSNLELTTQFGSVVLRPVWDESIPLNMVYINNMGNMLIKNVPDDVRREFKAICIRKETTMREEIIRFMTEEVEKAARKGP